MEARQRCVRYVEKQLYYQAYVIPNLPCRKPNVMRTASDKLEGKLRELLHADLCNWAIVLLCDSSTRNQRNCFRDCYDMIRLCVTEHEMCHLPHQPNTFHEHIGHIVGNHGLHGA